MVPKLTLAFRSHLMVQSICNAGRARWGIFFPEDGQDVSSWRQP